MAIIELVDRDIEAKKVDIKKKDDKKEKPTPELNLKDKDQPKEKTSKK